MCNLSQGIRQKAYAEGYAESYAEGRFEVRLESILSLIHICVCALNCRRSISQRRNACLS